MTVPYRYQIKAVRAAHKFSGRCLMALDMGLGKSLVSLLYAQRHLHLRPIVVICPATLKWNWEHEAVKHVQMRADILSGRKPPRGGFKPRHRLIIINYDILKDWVKYLLKLKPQLVVIDECSALGNRQSKRSRAVKVLCRDVPHVLALSGTPLTNRPAELWPTLNILRPDLYPSFFPFGFLYCGAKKNHWGWEFKGATRLKRLHNNLLEQVMVRERKEDVLKELPSKRRVVLPFEISRDEYSRALHGFLSWMADRNPSKLRTAERAEGLVKLGYLRRLAAKLKLPQVIEWVDSFMKEEDGKLVLFAIHRKIIARLQKRYKGICVVVDGSVKGRHRQLAVEQFQTKNATRLFIGNVKAAGVGLTLTAANTVAIAELGWTPGEMTQAEDRTHRIGQKKSVTVYYLIAKDTIEEDLLKLITKKQKILNAVVDGKGKGDNLNLFDKLVQALQRGSRK